MQSRQKVLCVGEAGDTLTEKRILTGLNDDSNVKVINGLIAK